MARKMIMIAAATAALAASVLSATAEETTKWECIWSGGHWVSDMFGSGGGFCYDNLPSAFRAAPHGRTSAKFKTTAGSRSHLKR